LSYRPGGAAISIDICTKPSLLVCCAVLLHHASLRAFGQRLEWCGKSAAAIGVYSTQEPGDCACLNDPPLSSLGSKLLRHGAKEDIFTHAFLCELGALQEDLAHEPSSAQASDPAVDALEITPLHHAVAGRHVEPLRVLLACVLDAKEPLRGVNRALRMAVAHENVAIVVLLLDHGADATTIGAGRWVTHPELAPMLSRAGARVDRSGNWIQLSCTGNQGRKDDPEYVAALLRHGARVDDRRESPNDRRRTSDRATLCRQSWLREDHRGSARSRRRSGLPGRQWAHAARLARSGIKIHRSRCGSLLAPSQASAVRASRSVTMTPGLRSAAQIADQVSSWPDPEVRTAGPRVRLLT
jgi:hypothetical protein